ncbi:DUF349 domain-containing protein [Zeaxanthinibacter sp. PT1]|uniref:DUF349 domain-containing protein n=1 Tax=Zeaxanthinibacter TaxID=561554 RepID=UPI00234BF959|nr:DUF349 domain-containing protein [Zeaxanthinibacter sp. PT1]MDC6352145.1 DUF349 domain-containing protein [Zeaxanthinibacter sp. PT1]
MLEEQKDKLQDAVGGNEKSGTTGTETSQEKSTEDLPEKEHSQDTLNEENAEEQLASDESNDSELQEEIDESNAEDAEDEDNHQRHHIPILDYHEMSMENLVGELQRLVRNEKVQAIRKHVEGIKTEFDLKFQDFLEEKKEDFISKGGNEIDFKYNSVTKRQFNEVYADYREKRNQYYKNLEQNLKTNLQNRLEIIEELKSLVNVEEDINTTYKNFKELQERWRNAGPVPRSSYNDVWRTYHHHIEIFYDFLHLNRELRDLDFKHNLEEKLKLIERAEKLAEEPDLNKAFRELQTLHKIWKEDIGPVDQEHREKIWEQFSTATKAMHQRRQDHYKELDKVYEKNLEKKEELIAKIAHIAENVANNHRAIQQQIKEVESLREAFFKAGKVPQKVNEATWSKFKTAVRGFNRNKNAYYKNLKKEQQENLDKKRALLALAVELKDSEDWEQTTPEMKRIQNEWKKIGHVPRKYSDSIWKDFKTACNHYFDRLHARKNKDHKKEAENYEKKSACLEQLKEFTLSGDRDKDIETIKGFVTEWKSHGRVPFNKKGITNKFNKILDALFRKLDISQQEAELLKYGNKIQQLAKTEDEDALYKERTFIRRKISDAKDEIRQLENNLQFFSGATDSNPLVQEVVQNIERHKEALATWKTKLKKLNILQNDLIRAAESEDEESDDSEE